MYSCSCRDGYTSGLCNYHYISEYETECNVLLSTSSETLDGNCNMDVDECASGACQHNSTCHNGDSEWRCDCLEITNVRTGEREAYDGEMCEHEINVCEYGEDDCDPNYATVPPTPQKPPTHPLRYGSVVIITNLHRTNRYRTH
jgi:Notch-like protein